MMEHAGLGAVRADGGTVLLEMLQARADVWVKLTYPYGARWPRIRPARSNVNAATYVVKDPAFRWHVDLVSMR